MAQQSLTILIHAIHFQSNCWQKGQHRKSPLYSHVNPMLPLATIFKSQCNQPVWTILTGHLSKCDIRAHSAHQWTYHNRCSSCDPTMQIAASFRAVTQTFRIAKQQGVFKCRSYHWPSLALWVTVVLYLQLQTTSTPSLNHQLRYNSWTNREIYGLSWHWYLFHLI